MTVVVISLAKGIIHPYYSVAAAPAIGAMVGHRRARPCGSGDSHVGARVALAVALAATAVWSYVLLDRAPQWMPWLAPAVLVALGLGCALLLVVAPRLRGRAALALGVVGVCAALAGPAAYALDTAATAHSGAIPSAGPASASGPGRCAWSSRRHLRRGPRRRPRRPPGAAGAGACAIARRWRARCPRASAPVRGALTGPPAAGGGFPSGSPPTRGSGPAPGARRASGANAGRPGRRRGAGGFLSISTPGSKLVKALEADAGTYTWVAATVNSNSAAGYQLATDDPVMAIGGFNGTDPAPTLAQFERDVADEEDPLLHLRRAVGSAAGRSGIDRRTDHPVGREPLHRRHARRRHGLRPGPLIEMPCGPGRARRLSRPRPRRSPGR